MHIAAVGGCHGEEHLPRLWAVYASESYKNDPRLSQCSLAMFQTHLDLLLLVNLHQLKDDHDPRHIEGGEDQPGCSPCA